MDNNQDQQNNQSITMDDVKGKTAVALSELLANSDNSNPEEKFATAMMALKYSQDPKIANTAFEAASAIEDTQKKSEMLVRILSEIGYIEESK